MTAFHRFISRFRKPIPIEDLNYVTQRYDAYEEEIQKLVGASNVLGLAIQERISTIRKEQEKLAI